MTLREGEGKTALVTGASAGIGEAFAKELASRGFDLVITARRLERLERLARALTGAHGVRALPLAEDLADPEAPERLVRHAREAGFRVDVLVNNAGYGVPGTFATTTWQQQADFLQVLVTAGVHLTHLLLPGMLERRWGRIAAVASLAGLLPGTPGHTQYAAAKSFMIKFSESLAAELEGTGVTATAVCPGFTYSEFHDVTGTREAVSKMPGFLWMTSEEVAREGVDATLRGDVVWVNGGVNKGIAALGKLLPGPVARALIKRRASQFRKL
jgi:short-subunit dehydrogenase